MKPHDANARQQLLDAAMKQFAERGYAGASVQDIVSATGFTKPMLYYYFESKEGLFTALLDYCCDECFELMKKAAARSERLEEQLVEILAAHFEFLRERRDLTRLSFQAAFAAPGEMPASQKILEKRMRNFEFVHSLIRGGMARGELDRGFNSRELLYGIYGALCFYLMADLLLPETKLDRKAAQRIVRLFLDGAGRKKQGGKR